MARIGSLGASLRSAWAQNNPINLAWPVLSAPPPTAQGAPRIPSPVGGAEISWVIPQET